MLASTEWMPLIKAIYSGEKKRIKLLSQVHRENEIFMVADISVGFICDFLLCIKSRLYIQLP